MVTGVGQGLMLPWLIAPFFLASGSVVPAFLQAGIETALPREMILTVLPHLDLGSLYETLAVSHAFHWMALDAIKSLYGTRSAKGFLLNYSQILTEREMLIRDFSTAGVSLQDSLEYKCLQFLLEAEFGHCTLHRAGHLPVFYLPDAAFDIVNDEHKVSVLPYVLDHDPESLWWIHYVCRIVELGKLELLEQMTFPDIDSSCLYDLMNVSALPECVFMAAARSFQREQPYMELSGLLALLDLGEQRNELPAQYELPVCLFKRLYERKVPIPGAYRLVCGLSEASFPFWVCAFSEPAEEARMLQDLVREHGDTGSKIMLRAFTESVPETDVPLLLCDKYRALLTRIRFSPVCNEHISDNYRSMVRGLSEVGYEIVCAVLDCKQYSLFDQFGFGKLSTIETEVLIDRIHQLNEPALAPYMAKCAQHYDEAPRLLKRLVMRKAADSYVQLVKSSLESTMSSHSIDYQCCLAPLDVLQRLAYRQYASVEDIESVLGMLHGFQWMEKAVPREVHVLYTVMFWEQPEAVIRHFLALVPTGCKLDYDRASRLLTGRKYSGKLLAEIITRCEGPSFSMVAGIQSFRLDVDGIPWTSQRCL